MEGLQTSGLPTLRDQVALQAYQAAALAAAKAKAQPGPKGTRGAEGGAADKGAAGAAASPFAAPAAQAAGEGQTALALYGRQDHVATVRDVRRSAYRVMRGAGSCDFAADFLVGMERLCSHSLALHPLHVCAGTWPVAKGMPAVATVNASWCKCTGSACAGTQVADLTHVVVSVTGW